MAPIGQERAIDLFIGEGLTRIGNAPIIQTMPRVVLGDLTGQDKPGLQTAERQ